MSSTKVMEGSVRSSVMTLREVATGALHELAADGRRWTIGGGDGCEIRLADPYISNVHCQIERRPGNVLLVRDRGSKNGTRLDGSRIEGAELRVGSYLTLGSTTLVALGARNQPRTRAIEQIRGSSRELRATIDKAQRAAVSEHSVLILGETGTGKDLLARVIHEGSRRASGPFVAVNCGAIPRELVGSELFGHDKGAFTGAHADRDGYFAEADHGTLFLDELGELPLELQPNLLRILETRRVRRVGGSVERPVDVRIVAATNRVEGLGADNSRVRVDLYHRLATVVLELPPLRERISDLEELVEATLEEHAAEHGARRVKAEAWPMLKSYAWPGNVRELRGAVARAVALGGDELDATDFFPDLRRRMPLGTPATPEQRIVPYEIHLREMMERAWTQKGTIRAAAEALKMPKSTFADRAKAWGLKKPGKK